ncbi:MAG: glucose-1-phosphate adenylyltransferase [Gammaproteobacteria bacterium]|nr:glucose-1-phosphate adenylyltransferase [Gammaproteobacteria bacterium]
MNNLTQTIILAGGRGNRLSPLTEERSKPAVPFGGKYRIIDFALANCLHSGLRKILVLTQYKSFSLQKHLRDGWSVFNPELGEYITSVPPQMQVGNHWYRGTADAVYQNLNLIKNSGAQWILILSGDHIYRMDYAAMIKYHREHSADMTVACMPVKVNEAHAFGVISVDQNNTITAFSEKPDSPAVIPDDPDHSLASMGIYVFSTELLIDALESDSRNETSSHDFGKDIIPQLINDSSIFAYRFGTTEGRVTPDRYWRDVGTIDSYYNANMDLLATIPPLDLYQSDWPIRSYSAKNPPFRAIQGASAHEGVLINSMAAGGVIISGGGVHHSILFANVFVDDKAMVNNSILFENVHVGPDAQLVNCIVDKNVTIPAGETIGIDSEKDAQRFTVSENGIVVVPKNYQF